ncbi:MAG: hypothetical protein K6G88_08525 [Lachnospiraceae bacterium]|nr:hypothetical protein [Lachnospiraceae bacterium]
MKRKTYYRIFFETKPDNQLIIKSDNEGIYRLKYKFIALISDKIRLQYKCI